MLLFEALPEVLAGLILAYLDVEFVETVIGLASQRCNQIVNHQMVCNLRKTPGRYNRRGFEQLCTKYKRIQFLDFCSHRWFDNSCLKNISNLPLTTLDLCWTKITDSGLVHISKLPLTTLYLYETKITDAGLIRLSKLPLTTLHLDGTKITDAGLMHLSKLPLTTLYLGYTKITDSGLVHLSKLPLTALYLCLTKITDAGKAYIEEQLPNCKIYF